MSYVLLDVWKKYARKQDSDTDGEALYQLYIDAAEKIVEDNLSYSPASASYTHTLVGSGMAYLQLRAKPITELTSVTVDGISRDVGDFYINDEYITDITRAAFPNGATIIVEYTAGWAAVPALIQMAVMEIASLLSLQAGENIGVSSTTFDGGNTRSFINYTSFEKYLRPLSSYRVVRL